ncbi:LAMI_0E03466g1_1 [Lachancea mirantina]|uniref:LAMI_0E03466g1_1 n=1 Tax=Lachancea mirantina TaxID=1230905 RepID=A0A1G4JJR6_9SACH|nr:LAMI_0E03466g1_1 [Lachancea mirantina]
MSEHEEKPVEQQIEESQPAPTDAATTEQPQAAPAVETTTADDVTDAEQASVKPANATKGGRETSDRILYVGNLDLSVSEEMLKQYFQVGGPVANVKILMDKNNQHANYAFVEFFKPHDANVAFLTLDGKQIENNVVKINWAFQSQQVSAEDAYNLFVGDLSVDVDDETLAGTFREYPSFVQAHVMWDMQTGRSRGYGFVSFGEQEQAQSAMETKQGFVLNGRALRINWASKRDNTQNNNSHHSNGGNMRGPRRGGFRGQNSNNQFRPMMGPSMGMPPQGAPIPGMGMPPAQAGGPQVPQMQAPMVPPQVNPQAVDTMIRSAPPRITTVYIGNIPHFATEPDLIPLLQNFGFIVDFKHYPDRGCCFVKYGTHEQAAVCIVALGNFPFQGRNLRTGWGKEKPTFFPQTKSGPMINSMPGIPVQEPQPILQQPSEQPEESN